MDENDDDDVNAVNERNEDASVDKVNAINKPAQQYTRVRGQAITTHEEDHRPGQEFSQAIGNHPLHGLTMQTDAPIKKF